MKATCTHYQGECDHLVCPRDAAEERAVSIRKAISSLAVQLRYREGYLRAQVFRFATDAQRLNIKAQILDLEQELSELTTL